MRRDHSFAQRRMSGYIDDELGPRPRARLARHAHDCPDCGPLLRGLTILVPELRGLSRPRLDHSVVPSVLERLRVDRQSATDA
jgi:anti-sigma factor RsiW